MARVHLHFDNVNKLCIQTDSIFMRDLGYMYDLESLIISHELCVPHRSRSVCKAQSVYLRARLP